jgi:hypothetical protein
MMMDLKKIYDSPIDSGEIDPQLIGSLKYLVNTITNICYAVNVLCQIMIQLRQTHWIATKNVLRYLRGTFGYGLRYGSIVDLSMQGYTDADWEGSIVNWKRTSNFFLP